jgi:riboflavin synthase
MLEVHVALVNGLETGAAGDPAHGEHDQEPKAPHGTHRRSVGREALERNLADWTAAPAVTTSEASMFTGLVAASGVLAARSPRGPGARLGIRGRFDDGPLALGESIAVDGVCLSVDAIRPDGFEADASAETLTRTTLGLLEPASLVHLERALRAGDRMGGHIVTGHVDGVGELVARQPVGEAVSMSFRIPPELARFVAEKGSIAVDGVSLTVNSVNDDGFEVTIVPITLEKTKLGVLRPAQRVNLEVDLVARYVARWMSPQGLKARSAHD